MPPTPAQPKSPTFAAHPTVGRAYAPDARATRIPDVRPTPPVGRAYAPDARATKIADDCRAFAGAKSRRGRSPDLRPSPCIPPQVGPKRPTHAQQESPPFARHPRRKGRRPRRTHTQNRHRTPDTHDQKPSETHARPTLT